MESNSSCLSALDSDFIIRGGVLCLLEVGILDMLGRTGDEACNTAEEAEEVGITGWFGSTFSAYARSSSEH